MEETATTKRAILEVTDLSKAFDIPVHQMLPAGPANRFWSLRDISLEVHPGEALGIIGANGAGKSTLLKILGGIMRPTSGRIRFRGKVASILDIGSGFHPELTGRENIGLSGRLLGFSKKEIAARHEAIIAFSEIEPFIDTPVKYYSAGMFLRLAFSVVVHLPADLLFFDEVLAVGDAAFQQKCLEKIRELKHTSRAFVLVSHDLNNLAQVCDRIMVLDHGRMAFCGDVGSALTFFARQMAPKEDALARPRPGVFRPPHSDLVKELSVKINGEAVKEHRFDCLEPLVFDIITALHRPAPGLHMGLAVADAKNNVLFGANTLPGPPIHSQQLQLTWSLPPDILNAGAYWLNLYLIQDGQITESFLQIEKFAIAVNHDRFRAAVSQYYSLHVPSRLELRGEPLSNEDEKN